MRRWFTGVGLRPRTSRGPFTPGFYDVVIHPDPLGGRRLAERAGLNDSGFRENMESRNGLKLVPNYFRILDPLRPHDALEMLVWPSGVLREALDYPLAVRQL